MKFQIPDVERYAAVEQSESGTLSQTLKVTVTKAGFVEINGSPVGFVHEGDESITIALVAAVLAAGVFRVHAKRSKAAG